jgi:uncharacterized membrane protein YfcA
MLSNVALSLIGMLILIVSGYLISSFFDLEMAYYMPYLLWLLGLCVFNMFLDKSHVNIYSKKTDNDGEENKVPSPLTSKNIALFNTTEKGKGKAEETTKREGSLTPSQWGGPY